MTIMRVLSQAYSVEEPSREDNAAIPRETLVSRISDALSAEKRLVVIKAPAGYGKTTLLRQFIDAEHLGARLRVWVGLSASDADPVQFVSKLITSYINAAGDINLAGISLPDRQSRSPDDSLADLIGLMRRQPAGAVFVIDEYQNAANAETDRLLKMFLQQTPHNAATVIAVRDEPACGVAKMRLDGEVADIGSVDLSFGVEDVHRLFDGLDLSRSDIEILFEKTRGWPAALCLARMWLRDSGRIGGGVAKFAGDLPEVAAYISEEVIAGLPEDVRRFLEKISILRDFNAEIADALLERRDSAQMLRRLETMNSFICFPDSERTRYSHHPLLVDYLRSRLYAKMSSKDVEALHRSAADYFFKRGHYLLALEHAVETCDEKSIIDILDQEEFGLLWLTADGEAFFRIMRRVEQIDPQMSVRLLPAYAFYRMKEGDHEEAAALLARTRRVLDEDNSAILKGKGRSFAEADYWLIKATHCIYKDESDGAADILQKLEQHLQASGIAHPLYIGVLNNAMGLLRYRFGDVGEALVRFETAVEKFEEANSQYGVIHNTLHAAQICMLKANMGAANEHIQRARLRCNRFLSGDYTLSAAINVARAEALYEAGASDEVRIIASSARMAIASGRDYWVELLESAFHVDARLQFAKQGFSAVSNLLGHGFEIAEMNGFGRLKSYLIAERIHLAAIAGERDLARSLRDECKWTLDAVDIRLTEFGWRENICRLFALARLEIALGNPRRALDALDRVDPPLAASGYDRLVLKSKALRALALFVEEQLQEASALMRALIEEGEARGLKSFFLEEGLLAQQLLDETARRFQRSKKADEFNSIVLGWLISSFAYVPSTQHIVRPELSAQQKRILELLAMGQDRQEIANNANTTIHNVQYHLKKMFDLFGVNSSARLVAETVRLKIVNDRTARVSQQ